MKRLLLLLPMLCGLVAGGCGDSLPEADLTFITSTEHHDLDPSQISWLHDGRVAQLLFEPLVVYDFDAMQVVPGVAERWEISEDGRAYMFHLRENARWSNGEAVTADDFIYAWRRVLLPDFAADYSKHLFHIRGAEAFFNWRVTQLQEYQRVREQAGGQSAAAAHDAAAQVWAIAEARFNETVGLSAPDARTLVVELERPLPYFLELAAFVTCMPVHTASVEAATSLDPNTGMLTTQSQYWTDPDALVSNGAYDLAGTAFQRYTYLQANEHYWNRAAVANSSILERIIPDAQNAEMTYRAGGADLWPDVPSMLPIAAGLANSGRDDVHVQDMAATYFYNFNCLPQLPDGSANPLADARVRRALSLAIDREVLVQRITGLNQPVARTFVPPGSMRDYEPPVEHGVTFDPDAARALLAEAGYDDPGTLRGLSIMVNTDQGHEIIAQAIKNMWEQHLGVVVTTLGVSSKVFGERLKSQNYTIARASWFGDYPDPTTFLNKMMSSNGNNDAKWSNAEYDALLTEAETLTDDPAARMRTLREAERIMVEQQPIAPLMHYRSVYLWDPQRVQGVRTNPWAQWRFQDIRVQGEKPTD